MYVAVSIYVQYNAYPLQFRKCLLCTEEGESHYSHSKPVSIKQISLQVLLIEKYVEHCC